MSYRACVFALVLALSGSSALGADQDEKERVRAKKPTVVTVEGKLDPVETQRAPQNQGLGGKITSGVKTGAAKVWNGLIGFTGWMLNVEDDIPSERERRERGTQEDDKQSK
jgi:hypothetical protein